MGFLAVEQGLWTKLNCKEQVLLKHLFKNHNAHISFFPVRNYGVALFPNPASPGPEKWHGLPSGLNMAAEEGGTLVHSQ